MTGNIENTQFNKKKLEEQVGNAVFGAIKDVIPPFVVEMLGGEDFFKKMQAEFKDHGGQILNAFVDVPDRNATGQYAVNSPTVQDQRTPDQIAQNAGQGVV